MKSPTFGPLSAPVGPSVRAALTALCVTATLFACQNNSATPATETAATSTEAPKSEAPPPTLAAPVSSVVATSAPSEAAEPEDEVKPSVASTSAKTPRPKPENGNDAVDPKPATSAPAAVAASPEAEPPAIDKPCLAKSFEFSSVKAACEKGGVPKAKALMKTWTKKAKEKGEDYKCTSCHDNQRTYSNKPGADADLRKLLNLIK
jgi:hypothetical protein